MNVTLEPQALSGFLWWGLPTGKLAASMVDKYGGEKAAWERVIPAIQKGYEISVKTKGSPIFRASDRATYQTATRTAEATGFELGTVTAYLTVLEGLATQGAIDPGYWTPGLEKEYRAETGFNVAKVAGGLYGKARTVGLIAIAGLALWYGGPLLRRLSGGNRRAA